MASNPKRVWCAVSGHGFGHWAQLGPVIKALLDQKADLTIHVTGGVPSRLIANTLQHPFTHDPRNRDVGLVQPDPLRVDLNGTTHALHALHHPWSRRVAEEQQLMKAWRPDLILGNIPYLPMEAGNRLGIPTVALTSLTWDQVLIAYYPPDDPQAADWIGTMQAAYRRTTLALRITPPLPVHPFAETLTIPPITTLGTRRPVALREALGIDPGDSRPLVLVTLGGIPADSLPIAALTIQADYHWLVDQPLAPDAAPHLHALQRVESWPFADLTASVEAIVSKPGYGMAISATANRVPFLYVRRGTFPDERPIAQWCARHGRAAEITPEAFRSGAFTAQLATLLQHPAPPAPEVNGATVAAELLEKRFLG
ncbi:MAG: hypothetical protein HQL98_02020 [Magnetococcales bacterium]|nr:hypothetical protein [Magnetococcales bacterium]